MSVDMLTSFKNKNNVPVAKASNPEYTTYAYTISSIVDILSGHFRCDRENNTYSDMEILDVHYYFGVCVGGQNDWKKSGTGTDQST
ncbi:MAG: hypothetical protein LUC90_02915 [Lachnospiraceae bacterium]|nr:hypothetical protein [Lachnospiraceae bacterium]